MKLNTKQRTRKETKKPDSLYCSPTQLTTKGSAFIDNDKRGIIKINAKLQDNQITIQISDNGKGIENVDIAKEPLYTTKPNLERSGMGFTIMESFMDSMEVESIVGLGTKVTMTKKIKPKIDNQEEEEFQMITKD